MKPSITIGIPTYNGAEYISECIESILAQTFSNFEIIVVDDQSSDETLDIVKKYQYQDSRIKLFTNPKNLGLVGNWNRCIELAQGEWIKFVFQDDLIEADCLEQMLKVTGDQPRLICCQRKFLFEDGVSQITRQNYQRILERFSLGVIFPEMTQISAGQYCEYLLDYIGINIVGEPVATLIHRSFFYRLGFFNPYLTQICDFEMWTRIGIYSGITYIPEPLAIFRVHPQSTSSINTGIRQYRGQFLDNLILLHDFVFHPVYAPLRQVAAQKKLVKMENRWTANSLLNLFKNHSYTLRRIAEKGGNCPEKDRPNLIKEWQNIVESYPLILEASKRSLFRRIIEHSQYRLQQMQG